MNKTHLLIALVIFTGSICKAQVMHESVNWTGITIRKDVKDFRLYFQNEARSNLSPTYIGEYYTELGLKYSINKYFALGQYYRFTNIYKPYYSSEQRIISDFEFSYDFYRLSLGYRLRYQRTQENVAEYPEISNTFRNLVEFSYDIYRSPLEPVIGIEAFNDMVIGNIEGVRKIRLISALDWDINDLFSVSAGYRFEKLYLSKTPSVNHIIVTRLNITF